MPCGKKYKGSKKGSMRKGKVAYKKANSPKKGLTPSKMKTR